MAESSPRTPAEIQADLKELESLRRQAAGRTDENSRIALGIFGELIRTRAAELALAVTQEPDAESIA